MKGQILLLRLMRCGRTMAHMDPIAALHIAGVSQRAMLGARVSDPTIPAAARRARRFRFVSPLRLGRGGPASMGATERPRSAPAPNQ
jgi:hypothetical protein